MQGYNNKEMLAQFEELVYDFLAYRKSKGTQGYKIQSQGTPYEYDYQIGRGWPYYKNLEYISGEISEANPTESLPEPQLKSQSTENKLPLPLDFSKSPVSEDLKNHYGAVNKILLSYVKKALYEVDYQQSLKPQEEIVDKTVERVIEAVRLNHIEFNDQEPECAVGGWGRYSLLKALTEVLVLQELSHCDHHQAGPEHCGEDDKHSRYI